MFIIKLCFWLLLAVLVWHLLTKKYINPYKLYMVVGKKGSGKTTMLVRLAYEHLRKGWNVYSTERIPGCYYLSYHDIGVTKIPPNSLLLVDEVGMVWDARKFKDFPDHLRDWFKYQRHERVKVYLFSQTFDVDKKIRDLTDNMYLVTNKMRVFAYAKRIIKVPDLVKPTADGPARLDDVLKFDSLLWFWCGSRMLTFIPRYAKLFKSYEPLQLKNKEYDKVSDEGVPRSLLKPKYKSKYTRVGKARRKANRLKIIIQDRIVLLISKIQSFIRNHF